MNTSQPLRHFTIAKHVLVILVLVLGPWAMVEATTYYVDFAGGSDTNTGLSITTPWKHAPGDPLATGTPAGTALVPGDLVLLKGGVRYRGQIRNPFSGVSGLPITFKGDGWPGLEGIRAIIDGTEVYLGTWAPCASAGDCGGNPNWQHIYHSSFTGVISPFNQFFENQERVYVAQTPNMSDPFWDDNFSEYLPVTPANITLTSITDPSFLTQADSHYWDGAYIQIWVNPNVISIRKITSFDPANDRIYYESLAPEALFGDRNQYYSIVNQIHVLDRAGEYVVDESGKNIYYWPKGDIANLEFNLSQRDYGICTRGRSYITIDGFVLHGFASDTYARAIVDDWISQPGTGLVIKNNEIRQTRSKDGRRGSIELTYTNGVVIENNFIHHCQRNSGILANSDGIIIKDNVINKVGYKGLWFMGAKNARIMRNQFSECSGTHGNPVSIFTSENVLFAQNVMWGEGEVLTFERDGNLVIHNNIIHSLLRAGQETGSFVLRENGDNGYGYHIITNNTILNSESNFAIGIGNHPADPMKLIIKNNIADGGGNFLINDISHNLYTGLSWVQAPRFGWYLSTGELYETDLKKIFIDAVGLNLHLLATSPARNAGVDINTVIPAEIKNLYPDFDFAADMDGQRHGNDGAWDMGAYEYVPPVATGFYTLTPCRVLDTRSTSGPDTATPILAAGQRRVFTVTGKCGIPTNAKAISTNLTVVGATAEGDMKVVPGLLLSTNTSVMSIPIARARANNAAVQLAPDESGTIAVVNNSSGTVHFILDVNGYFR